MESQYPLPQIEGNCKAKDVALTKKLIICYSPQILNTSDDMLTNLWEALFSKSIMQLLEVCFLSDILNDWSGSTLSPGQGQICCEAYKI